MDKGFLSPDTNIALLNAASGDASSKVQNLKNAARKAELEKTDKAAKEFEAVFVAEMMKPMFEGISTDGMFSGGKGEEIFRGMLLQEYGKIVSQTGSIGISDQVRDEMLRMQESLNGGAE